METWKCLFQKYSELPGKGVNPKISDCTKWLMQKRERAREAGARVHKSKYRAAKTKR